MKIEKYLEKFNEKEIALIGPMPCGKSIFREPALYIDGGSNARRDSKGFSIGDNDSYQAKLDQLLPTEKDYSDLAFALSHCHKFHLLRLYGFLGGRKDHELINFGEIHHFLMDKTQTQAVFDDTILAFSQGEWKLELNQVFSLICFESTKLSLIGNIKYPLQNKVLRPVSSHGLSNIAFGEFTLITDKPCFIFPTA